MKSLIQLAAPFALALVAASALAAPKGIVGLAYEAAPYYSTTQPSTPATDNSGYNNRHRPAYGGEQDGVARLIIDTTEGSFLCSGALLGTGRHILTAAHCVTDGFGVLNTLGGTASFATTPTGSFTGLLSAPVSIASVAVNPGWNGDYIFNGYDLAILTLAEDAPVEATRYDIYRDSDEIGVVGTKSGWGTIAQGDVGAAGSPGSGWRTGQNIWELTAAEFWEDATVNDAIMMYDFDNGLAANDAFGAYFGLTDLGLGDFEVVSAPGDSGGPTFIDGKIAGITSFGLTFTDGRDAAGNRICLPGNPDILCGLNNSYGEFAGDTRVSAYAAWIDDILLPEPTSAWLVALALPLAGLGRWRARRVA
jgi:secreted trypsin-like serine protease